MCATWRELKLPDIQAEMDQTATDLANRKDESENSRKKLIAESKKFKKDTADEHRKAVAPLLKLFQGEIDALSKRSKAAEAAFLSIYKKIIEIPDPLSALETAEQNLKKLQKAADIEIENQKLRDTIDGYKKDFAEMKGHEVTIQKLQNQISDLTAANQDNVEQVVDEREKELQMLFTEKEREMRETQEMVAHKLAQTEQRAATTQQKLEGLQNELMETRSKFEEERTAKNEEVELLLADLDRANLNAQAAAKEAEELRNSFESQPKGVRTEGDGNQDQAQIITGLEAELTRKEREISQLTLDLSASEDKNTLEVQQLNRQLTSLMEKNKTYSDDNTALKNKLINQKDYMDVKKELDILKVTQFGEDEGKVASQSLEALLLSQNRSLQGENSSLRKETIDLNNQFKIVQSRENQLRSQVQNQEALIEKLEKDLLSVNALPSAYRTIGDGASTVNAQADFVADAIKDVTNQKSSALMQEMPVSNLSQDSSLLTIVQSQRERFRARVHDLEHENSIQTQTIQSLNQEIEQMRLDNVKLYEKIKFLQNYRGSGSTQFKSTFNDDEAGRKYANQYEEQLDPFSKFSRSERQRKYTSLSAHDKITLNMGRFILGNKVARTFVFIYTILIHCLLYLILYKFGNTTDCKNHLAELCFEKFGESKAPGGEF